MALKIKGGVAQWYSNGLQHRDYEGSNPSAPGLCPISLMDRIFLKGFSYDIEQEFIY